MSIGGLPSLNDGNNARAILYNALIDKYGAQMFISAGNSDNGLNSVGDPSVATKVMSIGAHWSHDSVLSNYGNSTPSAEGLHDFSSRGPREDGGFKPDVVAPGNALPAQPIPRDTRRWDRDLRARGHHDVDGAVPAHVHLLAQ